MTFIVVVKSYMEVSNETSDMRGQGYDGASNMSSDRVGVQARIQQAAPPST